MIEQIRESFADNSFAVFYGNDSIQPVKDFNNLKNIIKNKAKIKALIILDKGIAAQPYEFTDGEKAAKEILTRSSHDLSKIPLILMGYEDVFERISRKKKCWFLKYFCKCLPITCSEDEFQETLKNPVQPADKNALKKLEQRWFSSKLEYLARIEEYLFLLAERATDEDKEKYLLAISRNLTENFNLNLPLSLPVLQKLIRVKLKREEAHDVKTASAVGPVIMLEGAFLNGDINEDTFCKAVKDIFCQQIAYPSSAIKGYINHIKEDVKSAESDKPLSGLLENKTIALIDDNPELWEIVFKAVFTRSNLEIKDNPFSEKKVKEILQKSDLVFLDLYFKNLPKKQNRLPGMEKYPNKAFGHFILENWFTDFPVLPVILFTTSERADQAMQSMEIGADDFISKLVTDDKIDSLKIFQNFKTIVKNKVLKACYTGPIWEGIKEFENQDNEYDIFHLKEALNSFYSQATVFGKRVGLNPAAQGIVTIWSFIENKKIQFNNKLYYLIKSARNILAHGNVIDIPEIDLVLIIASLFTGCNLKNQNITLCENYFSYIIDSESELDKIKLKKTNILNLNNIKSLCKSIWEKICKCNIAKGYCVKSNDKFYPTKILDYSDVQCPASFTKDFHRNSNCYYKNNNIKPYFSRIQNGKGNTFCVYLGSNPKSYLLFDIISLVLNDISYQQVYYYNLLALRAENLYIKNFSRECGDLEYLYHYKDSM